MQQLDVGEVANIDTLWYDADGVAAEPSAITLVIHRPDGTDSTVLKGTMTGSESGALAGTTDRWTYGATVTLAGLWRYDVEGVVDTVTVKLPSGAFMVGSAIVQGPCEPWTSWDEVAECGPASLSTVSAAGRELAIDQASEILWDLTGRVYSGICETTRSLCYACRTCWPAWCSCEPHNGVDLGIRFPVWGAWDVTVDGEVLPTTAFEVVNRRWLVRTDGDGWPTGADISDPSAFRATWAYGRPIPIGGRRAAAMFASEIAKLCNGLADCQLPKRVTTINREGTTFTILDPMTMISEGRTGLGLVDLWIVADKKGRKSPPGIFAPGAYGHAPRRIT